jgi:hypothetical protein
MECYTGGPELPQGAELLDSVDAFLTRFVAYPSEHARIAHVLWIAHTHLMDCWESTPRIAFLSPEPGSGKSRCLEVTEPLVPRPVHAVNTTPAYLFRKVSDEAGPPTILYDEIDTVFGPKAKDNEDIRGMLNAGHRKGAVAGRCVVRGKIVETEELPAYCAVALAGLNDLPDTVMSRSIVVRMRRRAPTEKVEPWRLRINAPQAEPIREALTAWAAESAEHITWPELPPQIQDRNADVWEALIAVADLAGGDWPERARCGAVALVADSMAGAPSIGVQLLTDLRSVFAGHDLLPTEAILAALHEMDERPWNDLRGKPVDSRWLSRQLSKYGIKSGTIRTSEGTPKGYKAADLHDPWTRYVADEAEAPWKLVDDDEGSTTCAVGVAAHGSATSATTPQPECSVCAQPLLLMTPGRTICEIRDDHHTSARVLAGVR